MRLAPQVFQFNQQLSQGRNPLQQFGDSVGSAIDAIGKGALLAGSLVGGAYLAKKGFDRLPTKYDAEGNLKTEAVETEKPAVAESLVEAAPVVTEREPVSTTRQAAEDFLQRMRADAGSSLEVDNEPDIGPVAVPQEISPNQTAITKAAREVGTALETVAESPVAQSEVVGSKQSFSPGGYKKAEADAFRADRAALILAAQQEALSGERQEIATAAPAASEPAATTPAAVTQTLASPAPVSIPGGEGDVSTPQFRELKETLRRGARNHWSTEEELNQLTRATISGQKLEQAAAPSGVAKPAGQVVVELDAPASARSAEFLAKYTTPKESKSPIREVTFGPGSEMEVNMRGRRYPYAAQDPFREAVGAYMSGEEQGQMGSAGSILAGKGIGPQMGLMQKLTEEGTPQEGAPSYRNFSGYMDERQIQKALASKGTSKSTEAKKAQALRHAESKQMMRALEERAAARQAPTGAIDQATFAGSPQASALLQRGAIAAAMRGAQLG
jgi:hypothetical protein